MDESATQTSLNNNFLLVQNTHLASYKVYSNFILNAQCCIFQKIQIMEKKISIHVNYTTLANK